MPFEANVHVPCPAQKYDPLQIEQSLPLQPCAHAHAPLAFEHTPCALHSVSLEHTSHDTPLQPCAHTQTGPASVELHVPCELQKYDASH